MRMHCTNIELQTTFVLKDQKSRGFHNTKKVLEGNSTYFEHVLTGESTWY